MSSDDETTEYMAEQATRDALDMAGLRPGQVDLIILSNCTTRRHFPESAPRIARRIAADQALAFDVCGACTGFVHGVQTASALLHSQPSWRTAVVVSSERFSRRAEPGSRSSLVVADAAGAAVLSKDTTTAEPGLVDSVLHSAGEHADVVVIDEKGWVRNQRGLMTELAIEYELAAVDEILARTALRLSDVDWVVPHPGPPKALKGVRDRLDIANDRVVTNFPDCGNTASASIPTTLSENIRNGRFRSGELFVTPAFGAGLYYGALLFYL